MPRSRRATKTRLALPAGVSPLGERTWPGALRAPLTITGGLPATVVRSSGLTLNWTGGSATDIVEIVGYGGNLVGTGQNATIDANKRKAVAEALLKNDLEIAGIRLTAAEDKARGIKAQGEAEAKSITLENKAHVAGIEQAIKGFPNPEAFAQYHIMAKLGPAGNRFGPVLDGRNLVSGNGPFDPVAPSLSAKVPMILGSTLTELARIQVDGSLELPAWQRTTESPPQIPIVKLNRWAQALGEASRASPLHARVIASAVSHLFRGDPFQTQQTANLQPLLILLKELLIETGQALTAPDARASLTR